LCVVDALRDFYSVHYSRLNKTQHMEKRFDLTVKAIREYAHSVKGDFVVLEIGCGTGENLQRLKAVFNFKKVFGVEISEDALRSASLKGVEGLLLDVNRDTLPIPSETVDIVLFEEVIGLLYNSDLALSEVRRVLKRGGLLVLSTPNLASWANRITLLLGYQPFSHDPSFIRGFGRLFLKEISSGHIKSFTKRALLEYLDYFGFKVAWCKGVIADADRIGNRLVKVLDKIFSSSPSLAFHVFIVAKKV
jgi:SAM-dependent methyltransferase